MSETALFERIGVSTSSTLCFSKYSLIVFILCLGFYVTPAVLGGGKVIMVSMQITAILEDQFNWGAASALGVVLLVTTFIFLLLASRLLKLDSIMFGRS